MTKAKDYGQQRRRDDPEHPGNKERLPRGRKNTKRWCRGKPGVEHQTVITRPTWVIRDCAAMNAMYAEPDRWRCLHIEMCQNCGKRLRFLDDDECPDKPADMKSHGQ